jgi:tetratricopeptide (TPR) repeat protein
VNALQLAVERNDAEAILAVLKDAKEMPEPVRAYATARALWASGDKAGVYSMWPDEPPPLADLAEGADWSGWEQVLDGEASGDFYEEIEAQVASLRAKPDATIDDFRALATLLLDPATTATFGSKRVRDAMVACSLVLANDKVSGPLVGKMVDRARLAGAPPTDCLRIEARSFMAAGEFTAAYSRWLQLIDTPDAEILAEDYLEAAACVFEDLQDAAAIELTMRGKDKFPADPAYAYDGAWLLLTAGHPEEAGILLEHGFKIPFTGDQKQTAVAMLLCAAEQTGRTDRADQAFQELLEISPDWGDEEAIKSLEWPEAMTENLLSVAGRNL